ncbi:MAG: hypothetical protein ABIJ75_10555 [Actinomycetota bacterium]
MDTPTCSCDRSMSAPILMRVVWNGVPYLHEKGCPVVVADPDRWCPATEVIDKLNGEVD